MPLLNTFMKFMVWFIYALFAAIVLYFPTMELVSYIARETRFFRMPGAFPIDDALVPLLCLALIYSVVAWLNRRIEKRTNGTKEHE